MADAAADRTASMSAAEKVGTAMRRSLPLLPEDARPTVLAMLEPASLAIIGGTLAVWAGSHLFGVGEVVDLILVGLGVVSLGFSVFDGARELLAFAKGATEAKSDKELDSAAEHFAAAVTILGISTIQALLLRSAPARAVTARRTITASQRVSLRPPPAPGGGLRLTRPQNLPSNYLGTTDAYGSIRVSRNQSIQSQRETLYHELVHRFFSPQMSPLRKLRAELRMSGYQRSALLRYLEEGLAEGYAQLKVNGFATASLAWRFPLDAGYVTVSDLRAEGYAIGSVLLGGKLFYVTLSLGQMPKEAK